MPAKNFENTRFSTLAHINTDSAKKLQAAWTFSTGVNRGQQAAPIVVGDSMYVCRHVLSKHSLRPPLEEQGRGEMRQYPTLRRVA
ncbi:MAG: hypothetical protein ABR514_11060 [Chthoniobacterales bacterium]